MTSFSARLSLLLASASFAVVGCSSGPAIDPVEQADLDACASGWLVRREGACDPVAGVGGRWEGSPTFGTSITMSGNGFCGYVWRPDAAAAPDRNALLAIETAPAFADACLSITPPPVTAAQEADISFLSVGGEGVHGCDVCIEVQNEQLDIVFPPDMEVIGVAVIVSPVRWVGLAVKATRGRTAVVSLPADIHASDLAPGSVKLY